MEELPVEKSGKPLHKKGRAIAVTAAAAVLLAGAALGWHWLCGSGARILQKL